MAESWRRTTLSSKAVPVSANRLTSAFSSATRLASSSAAIAAPELCRDSSTLPSTTRIPTIDVIARTEHRNNKTPKPAKARVRADNRVAPKN